MAKPELRRCAVYTRNSSEEGLEQDFNSLHAQREACEAFIRSQAGEGWKLIKAHYDDGGISGGTMENLEPIKHTLAGIRLKGCLVLMVLLASMSIDGLAGPQPGPPRSDG